MMKTKALTKKGNRAALTKVPQINPVDNLLNALINVGVYMYSQPMPISISKK